MQTAVHFTQSRACLIFGVAEYDRQQSKKPWSHHQACSVGIFYAIGFGWIWSEEKGFSRPFILGTTPFFPVPVPATWEGEDLKTDPLTVPLWSSSMDNVMSGVSCSHLLSGHRRCFPSVSSRCAATALTQLSTAATENVEMNESPGGDMEGNIRQHPSPPEACLGVSQPLTSPISFLLLLLTFPVLSTQVRSSKMRE